MTNPQVWLVTGASSGFGAAFARRALSAGHSVAAIARSVDRLRELQALAPGRVLELPADLVVPGVARSAVESTLDRFGRIDVLINNAGVGLLGSVEETTEAELRSLFELNFFAAVEVLRAALPALRARGGGTVVTMSSFLGQLSMAGLGAYSATKFALEGLSEALAAELASFGVRVLIVEPGGFRTGFNGDAFRMATPVDAYRPALDPLRTFVAGFGSRAPGDPARAADALLRLLDEPALPLRVQLGTDSADAIRQHSTSMLRDLAQWHEVAASTDYAHADAAR